MLANPSSEVYQAVALRQAQGDKKDVMMSAACPELAEGNHERF